jgi:D-lactate dehydrogenase (cytochrome)
VTETKEDIEQSFLTAPLVGHVGDGNFHLVILIDPNRAEDLEESERLNTRLVQRALSMDGTCSGEHGVGIGKRRFLEEEHGEAMQAMRMVKKAIDPQNIMNPGKIVDLIEV